MSKLLVKAKHPEIQLSDPWADDVFERKAVGERLARLIANTPDNFVLALKAPFGSGKSVFIDRLSKHIESSANSMPVVSLNAWENDHHIDPMEALLVALSDRVQLIKSESIKEAAVTFLDNAIKYAVPVMKFGARAVLAFKTLGLSEAAIATAEIWALPIPQPLTPDYNCLKTLGSVNRTLSNSDRNYRMSGSNS